MKKILIIGSQGYLGSRLTNYFQGLGYDCTGTDTGFFQYGVIYQPHPVRFLGKAVQEITREDIQWA